MNLESLECRRLLSIAAASAVAGREHAFEVYVPPRVNLYEPGAYLSKPATGDTLSIALSYLRNNARDLGLAPADVESPFVTDRHTDADTGVTHIYLRQEFNGLPVANAELAVNLMSDGRVLSIAGGFVPGLGEQEKTVAAVSPALAPSQALLIAAEQLDLNIAASIRTVSRPRGLNRLTTLIAPDLSLDPIPARLQYVPTSSGVQLAWNMILRTPDGQHWYDLSVGDASREMVFLADWTSHASYNVLARPTESPVDGPSSPNRTIVTDPHDTAASPYGWHDTNGAAGAEYTDTRGNNVFAQEDTDANNTGGMRPSGGASLVFDFPLDLTQAPSAYQSAAITNLFYWNNVLHDVHYKYGFTEAAGNFQVNNYGRGGTGNDPVQADAQDGAGTNNANFSTPPDGSAPRMQMFRFTYTTPNRDGDLDNMIIVHEYGHGVSTRLTGGPSNSSSLSAVQSGGMGEGWSDWWGLMFTMKSTDAQMDSYPVGTYVLGQPPTGSGIRRFKYSYDMSIDPLTIDNYGTSGTGGGAARSIQVHNVGEIWCSALWDMTWLLINKYGFESDIETGYAGPGDAGNKLALRLVSDALKLQPSNPSFKEARDAILQADQVLTGGANQAEIWQAFARRGMGASFVSGSSTSTSVTPAYDLPVFDPIVLTASPSGMSLVPVSLIDFNFNQAMNTSSFSVADDVASFTGPGGANMLSSITGYSWLDGDTLRINLAKPLAQGGYTIVIGPNILAADNNAAMDTNLNGTPGEIPADRFTLAFAHYPTIGPEGYGYQAAAFPYESIDLVPGGAGVTSILDGVDDAFTSISLGTNSFRFYGTAYNTIYVNSNGLITFGSGTDLWNNSDLTASPSTQAIAPLWDDWVTNKASSGATNDVVLYKFDDSNGDLIIDRLIIEWSNVRHVDSSATSPVTFQAILQLNTGGTPGRMLFNYVDLDAGYALYNNGAAATVGVKDSGTQGARRLLVAQNPTSHSWLGNGKAILVATDVLGPVIDPASFNYLTGQSVSLTFSEDVGATLAVGDLVLQDLTRSITVPAANLAMVYNAATNTATLTFPGYAGGVLPDGNYRLSIASSAVSDTAGNPLDGNGDGIIGGDHVFSFFVLAGDANRDRAVDITDLGILAANWQQSPRDFSQGDFNYDGLVDIADLGILASNWQGTVPGPQVAAGAPAPRFAPARRPIRYQDPEKLLTLVS